MPANADQSAAASKGTSIYKHMLTGSAWALAMNWTLRVIGLVNTMVLARMLMPADFGLVAMATMSYGFIETFANLGTGLLLIRQREATRAHCDTAWTIGLLRGAVVAAILVAAAPLLAAYFIEPRVVHITYVIALSSVLSGASNIGMVLVRKDLDFARDFRFVVATRLFTFLITLALAWALRNYWAIVIGMAAGAAFECALSYAMHPYRPRLSLALAGEYIKFSLVAVPLNIALYLNSRIDGFVVGRIAPTAVFGIYNVAAELATMMTYDLMVQFARALYPTYAKLTADRERLAQAFLTSFSTLAVVSIAFGLGLFAVSEDFVAVVLGQKWLDTAPLLKWLAIFGMLKAIAHNMTGGIFTVMGYERLAAALMYSRLALLTISCLVGAKLGEVTGVAIGATAASALAIPIVALFLVKTLPITTADVIRTLWRPLVAGFVMVAVVRVCHAHSVAVPLVTLMLDIATGAVVFPASLWCLWRMSGAPDGAERRILQAATNWYKGRRAP